MSPFYFKEGENWRKWTGEEIKLVDSRDSKITISTESLRWKGNPERELTLEMDTVRLRAQGEDKFHSVGRGTDRFREEGFDIIDDATGEIVSRVIYSKEPIK